MNGSGNFNITAGAVYFNGSSGGFSGNLTLVKESNLINNGTLTVGPGGLSSNASSDASFVNNGSLIINAGAGGTFAISSTSNSGTSFNDSGSCYVQSGTFTVSAPSATATCGPFNVAANAVLMFNTSSYNPTQPIAGTGTVVFNGGGSIGNAIGPVHLGINGGTVYCNSTTGTLSSLQINDLAYPNGNLNGPANFTVNGPTSLAGVNLSNVNIIANGPITIDNYLSNANIQANAGITFGPASSSMYGGSLTNSPGQLASYASGTGYPFYLSGDFFNQGIFNCSSFGLNGQGPFINTGIVNVTASSVFNLTTFNNSGAIYFNSPGGTPTISSYVGGSLCNTGIINVLAGNLLIDPAAYGASNSFGGSLVIAPGASTTVQLFANQTFSAAVSGAGSLFLEYGGTIAPSSFNLSGTTTVVGIMSISPGNTFGTSGPLVDNGVLTFIAGASGHLALKTVPSLQINSAHSLVLQPAASIASRMLLSVGSLTLLGTLDVGNNDLLIGGGASLSTIWSAVVSGYANGLWNGAGLTSASAKNDPSHLLALGVIQNNQSGSALFTAANPMDGIVPNAGDILVKSTYYGDANLDGRVDGSDYTGIDNGYLTASTGWFNGDFNYDGAVNGSDYTLIDNAFNRQGAQLTDELAHPVAQVTVPEPASMALCAILFSTTLRCRGRRAATLH